MGVIRVGLARKEEEKKKLWFSANDNDGQNNFFKTRDTFAKKIKKIIKNEKQKKNIYIYIGCIV